MQFFLIIFLFSSLIYTVYIYFVIYYCNSTVVLFTKNNDGGAGIFEIPTTQKIIYYFIIFRPISPENKVKISKL